MRFNGLIFFATLAFLILAGWIAYRSYYRLGFDYRRRPVRLGCIGLALMYGPCLALFCYMNYVFEWSVSVGEFIGSAIAPLIGLFCGTILSLVSWFILSKLFLSGKKNDDLIDN